MIFSPARKMKFALAEMNCLVPLADQMHLDAAWPVVVDRAMPPLGKIEIGAELAVGAHQHVEIEFRRHAGAVVVSSLQNVCSDFCRSTPMISPPLCPQSRHTREKMPRDFRLHVADRRARENRRRCAPVFATASAARTAGGNPRRPAGSRAPAFHGSTPQLIPLGAVLKYRPGRRRSDFRR